MRVSEDNRAAKSVAYRFHKSEGPTEGTEAVDPLEFLARVLIHVLVKRHVTPRYDGWYAKRLRGMRGKRDPIGTAAPLALVPVPRLTPTEATRLWAKALRRRS